MKRIRWKKIRTVTLVLFQLYFADDDQIHVRLLTSRLEDEDELLSFNRETSNVSSKSKEIDGRHWLNITVEQFLLVTSAAVHVSKHDSELSEGFESKDETRRLLSAQLECRRHQSGHLFTGAYRLPVLRDHAQH